MDFPTYHGRQSKVCVTACTEIAGGRDIGRALGRAYVYRVEAAHGGKRVM